MNAPLLRTASVGDALLPYLLYEGQGPPLLLLHATGFSAWLWHPVARELSREYRVVAPFLCNHRQADPEAGGLDWIVLAGDVVRLCKGLGIANPFLVGHSMGATLLVMAQARFGLPAAGMVLIEPILLPPEAYGTPLRVADHPLAARAIRRTNFWRDRSEALAHLRSRPLFQGWDEEALELYLEHGLVEDERGGLRLACPPRQEAALFLGGMHVDPWPLLAKVKSPVLVLAGGESENKGFIDLAKVRDGLPAAELDCLDGAGHLIPMERPGETARRIGDFFRRLRTAG